MSREGKRAPAIFFRTEAGGEPVREWLKGLTHPEDRKQIGVDRTDLEHNRIARILFYIDREGRMVLLHGFIKKTRKTPDKDLQLARSRKRQHERGLP